MSKEKFAVVVVTDSPRSISIARRGVPLMAAANYAASYNQHRGDSPRVAIVFPHPIRRAISLAVDKSASA
jgi:hypothetical protein